MRKIGVIDDDVHFPIRATGHTSEMPLRKRKRGEQVRFEFRLEVERFIDACSISLRLPTKLILL